MADEPDLDDVDIEAPQAPETSRHRLDVVLGLLGVAQTVMAVGSGAVWWFLLAGAAQCAGVGGCGYQLAAFLIAGPLILGNLVAGVLLFVNGGAATSERTTYWRAVFALGVFLSLVVDAALVLSPPR